MRKQYTQQRKVFYNSTRYLGINNPNAINLAANRIDLLFWASIQYYGNDFEMISRNLQVRNMNIIYNGYSLYHYFVENQNIMQFICNMY